MKRLHLSTNFLRKKMQIRNINKIKVVVFILISIIIIVEPFSFGYIASSNKKDPTFTIYTIVDSFKIPVLPTLPTQNGTFYK